MPARPGGGGRRWFFTLGYTSDKRRGAAPGRRGRVENLFGIKESREDDMGAPGERQAVGTAQKKSLRKEAQAKTTSG
jgi:hypothetical protein